MDGGCTWNPSLRRAPFFECGIGCVAVLINSHRTNPTDSSYVACSRHIHRAGRGCGHVAVNGQGTETVELSSVRFRMVESSTENIWP